MRAFPEALLLHQAPPNELASLARSFIDDQCRRAAFALFSRIERGEIVVVVGERCFSFGQPGSLSATVTVRDPAAFRAMVLGGSVGVAEAYMQGTWSCDDLAALTRIFAQNLKQLESMEAGAARFTRFAADLVTRAMHRNTRAGSRKNIAHHYDLSNDLFSLFLDSSMMYSSAIFPSEHSSLEEAQRTKLDRVCQKLELAPSDRLLEIGTGWGALAIHAAEQYGCSVTTTTVSLEQHRLASERVRARGLQDRVEVLLCDYRDLRGRYDKIVSIEMIEAVGHEYLEAYFRVCSERLAPDGQLLIQAITIADQHEARHRHSIDFVKQYIFPGSSIPSVTSMLEATTRATDLRLCHLEDLTPHYARTLRIWRERFMQRLPEVRKLGFDDAFIRMWEYYLAYCEGGFEERYLGSVHMLFTKPGARRGALERSQP